MCELFTFYMMKKWPCVGSLIDIAFMHVSVLAVSFLDTTHISEQHCQESTLSLSDTQTHSLSAYSRLYITEEFIFVHLIMTSLPDVPELL